MQDKIIKVDTREQYMNNMARYSIYVLYARFIPDIRDGLKTVQRRTLYAMWNDIGCTSIGTKRKSANTTGIVIAKYHPHGDVGVYDAMKTMTNPWEIKIPLINYDSNSGSIQGGPQAAARYTESYLSKFAVDNIIGDMNEAKEVVDWQSTFDNHTMEPECLPIKVPILLVNGFFAIAIGRRLEVPKHSLNDVIDATIQLLHNPNSKIILIPDPCQKCEIIDTDWKKISNMGFGYYTQRGIIQIDTAKNGNTILRIKSVPDLVTANSVVDKIEELIKNNILIQVQDIQDHSTEYALDIHIILKKGADPNYVKQVLYKNTMLQDTKRVNMEVIDGTEIKRVGYKAYLLYFLEFRKECKFRLYNIRLQKAETRLHQIDTYIKILESGDVEQIVHMIRNQASMEESYLVDWLMKKLKITDLQAKFVLHTEIGRLSKGHLNKYKEEQAKLLNDINGYINIITHEELINQEIEAELLDIKAKYGKPRQSILISEAEASGRQCMDEGSELQLRHRSSSGGLCGGCYRKRHKHQGPRCIGLATSNIISAMYVPIVETLANKQSKYYIVTLTRAGLIKRMDLNDVINATPSGIIYSKLNPNDQICDILIANHKSDIIVYTGTKALRFGIDDIPYLKRATLGNISMKTNEPIDGMSVVTAETKELVVVTAKGKFNKLSPSVLARSTRNRAGVKVIKLSKNDYIKNIFSCNGNVKIRITRIDEVIDINIDDIPMGSSISSGEKLCKDGVIKAELVQK